MNQRRRRRDRISWVRTVKRTGVAQPSRKRNRDAPPLPNPTPGPPMPKAPRLCPAGGCANLIRGSTRRCDQHTTKWTGQRSHSSTITSTAEWKRLRPKILQRDGHQCQIKTPGICLGNADTVDHVAAVSAGGAPYDPANLASACAPCNRHKATAERVAAGARRRAQRPKPLHPGLLR